MTDLIHSTTDNGLGLIYLKDQGIAGVSSKALSKMLKYDISNFRSFFLCKILKEGVVGDSLLGDYIRTKVPTSGGVQSCTFILEGGVVKVLEHIIQGKFKPETKTAAIEVYRKFALAGFKLYTMLQVAPEELRSMVSPESTATADTTAPIAKQADLPDKTDRIVALALKVSGQPGECALKALETLIA